jgi:hypothetical protein
VINGGPLTMAMESILYLLAFILVCMLYASAVQAIHDVKKEKKKWQKEKADALSASIPWPTTNETTSNAENAPEPMARVRTEMNFYDEILRVHTRKAQSDGRN